MRKGKVWGVRGGCRWGAFVVSLVRGDGDVSGGWNRRYSGGAIGAGGRGCWVVLRLADLLLFWSLFGAEGFSECGHSLDGRIIAEPINWLEMDTKRWVTLRSTRPTLAQPCNNFGCWHVAPRRQSIDRTRHGLPCFPLGHQLINRIHIRADASLTRAR